MDVKDKSILKELAGQVSEIAALPEQEEKRRLWRDHNMLRQTRPVIFCDPENGWNEIISEKDLACSDPMARDWERHLRREIFWGTKMGDDRVTEPYFDVPYAYTSDGWGKERQMYGGAHGGAYTWDPMIRDYGRDLPKLHYPRYVIDEKGTVELFLLAQSIFEPSLKVRTKMNWWWTLGLTSTMIEFRGIEQYMFDLYDYPEEVHATMNFLCDGTIRMIDFLEREGLLCSNVDGYVGSGGFGYTDELPVNGSNGVIHADEMWGFCESQETVSVSPEMFNEFVLPYQLKILDKFGLNCYGCCEPLHKRWNFIKKIPRLRRVSVSPWTDIPLMGEYLSNHYIYSMKPDPAYIAVSNPDFSFIRSQLKQALHDTRNCCVEVIMKDNNTIGNNPENVINWCRNAKELAQSL